MPDCGDVYTDGWDNLPAPDCGTACAGNSSETCGGHLSLDIYWNGYNLPSTPSIAQNVGDAGAVGSWVYMGCFK
jgi:hypothetical protein